MLSRPASAALALGLTTLLLATGCSEDEADETSVRVEGFVVACRDDTCVSLPAAGASLRLTGDGGTVVEGTLDDGGVFEGEVEPGFYSAEVALDELGLRSPSENSAEVAVAEGEFADVSIWLPSVSVRRLR